MPFLFGNTSMKHLLLAALLPLACLVQNAEAAKLLPLNDNTAAPYKGVYRWGQGGCIAGHYNTYATWVNRTGVWAVDFMPTEGWDKIRGEQWQLGTWGPWVAKDPAHRRFILSVPLLPGPWDGSGPRQGPDKNVPVSLELGAKGAYNEHFKILGENLVRYNLTNTILRLGWEFNGGWYTWRADSADKAPHFANYFKQIVTTMRAVPGGDFKFVWNPNIQSWWPYEPERAWPGDDYVDYIGLDIYDQSWIPNTYPLPEKASAKEILERQKRAWNDDLNNEKRYGLSYWPKFAKRHGNKPLCLPEWGSCLREDGHGGGDNPFFIEEMHAFIHTPANNVLFECYFDVTAGDGDHQLVPDPKGQRETKFPKSAAKYLELFALPLKK